MSLNVVPRHVRSRSRKRLLRFFEDKSPSAKFCFQASLERNWIFLPQLKSWLEKVPPTLELAASHWKKNLLSVHLFLNKSCCIITSELKVCWGLESYKIAFLKLEIFLANGDQSAPGVTQVSIRELVCIYHAQFDHHKILISIDFWPRDASFSNSQVIALFCFPNLVAVLEFWKIACQKIR